MYILFTFVLLSSLSSAYIRLEGTATITPPIRYAIAFINGMCFINGMLFLIRYFG